MTQDRALSVLWPLLGRHIAFHRRLVDLTANVKAALLLSQAIYWTRHGRDVEASGGWFLKTTAQWEMETGLSAKEQGSARELLRSFQLLSERRVGIPAKLHFRLCADRLVTLLSEHLGRANTLGKRTDAAALAELLGPSLAYHRKLAELGGGVHSGLMLSRALHLTRLRLKRQMDGWICGSASQWSHDIGLTRREQDTARHVLIQAGLWEELLSGVPPTRLARVRTEGLLAMLVGNCSSPDSSGVQAVRAVGDFAANRDAPIGGSSGRESHRLDQPNTPKQFRPLRHYSPAESANSLIQRSTSVSVQPLRPDDPLPPHDLPIDEELVYPLKLLPDEREAARLILTQVPQDAQVLLDELDARIRTNGIKTSPLAYLRGMVMRARAGEFLPEVGQRIAAERRRRVLEEQERAKHARDGAEDRSTPEQQAKLKARREEIASFLQQSRASRPQARRP